MAYSASVLDHYENPRNVGKFDPNDQTVGTGLVGLAQWVGLALSQVHESSLD